MRGVDGREMACGVPVGISLFDEVIAVVSRSVVRSLRGLVTIARKKEKKEKERTKYDLDLQQAPYRPKQTGQKCLVRNNPCGSHPIFESGVQTCFFYIVL